MHSIQDIALDNYLKNITFLKATDINLYNRIMMLSDAIEQDMYTERYHLEYIKEDDQFDIYDSKTDSFLYNKQPKQYINTALDSTNLDKTNTIDQLDATVYNSKHKYLIDENINLEKKERALVINDLFEYIEIFKTSTLFKDKQFKYIEKFIFVGTLLGTHIEPIHRKLKCSLYFICEQNLEIFRLSLFATQYYNIAQSSHLVFSIMDDDKQFHLKFNNYFNHAIRSNHTIKYYCSNYNIGNYFDQIIAAASLKSQLGYSYQKIIHGLLKPSITNIKQYPILNTKFDHKIFEKTSILFIAAGPSLKKNINWISKHQNHFLICAVGASVITLIEHDITPDIILSIDADEIIENQFPQNIHHKLSNCIFLAATITNNKILNIFPKENTILFEAIAAFKRNSLTMYGYSVGEIGINMLSILGANEIYMLGTDLALDPETGSTHIPGHQEYRELNIDSTDMKQNSIMEEESLHASNSQIVVKGNFRKEVITTLQLNKSIPSYNRSLEIILKKNPNIKVYNLSDGVYLNGTIPQKSDDVVINTNYKKISKKTILTYLNEHCEVGFNDYEKENIHKTILLINKVIDNVNNISKVKVKTYDSLQEQQTPILSIILDEFKPYQVYFIDRLFLGYILTMEPFLGYQFNAKLENEANLVKKVKKVWVKQMLQISQEYKDIVMSI